MQVGRVGGVANGERWSLLVVAVVSIDQSIDRAAQGRRLGLNQAKRRDLCVQSGARLARARRGGGQTTEQNRISGGAGGRSRERRTQARARERRLGRRPEWAEVIQCSGRLGRAQGKEKKQSRLSN